MTQLAPMGCALRRDGQDDSLPIGTWLFTGGCLWFVLVVTLIAGRAVSTGKISLGEILVGVIGAIGIILSAVMAWWPRHRRGFKAYFWLSEFGEKPIKQTMRQTIGTGTSTLRLSVKPHGEAEIHSFNIRCLGIDWHSWGRWRSAPQHIIRVLEVTDYQIAQGDSLASHMTPQEDKEGGLTMVYDVPIRLRPGAPMSLWVKIYAYQPWEGWLSFRNDLTGRKARVHLTVTTQEVGKGTMSPPAATRDLQDQPDRHNAA